MNSLLAQFASTEPAQAGIFEALGIDWKLLILQIIAFLLLVVILGKFVYPWLMKQVDERQDKIEAATKAAAAAQSAASDAEVKVEALLKKARAEAADIVATAKIESTTLYEKNEEKAKKRADQIVADAQSEIEKQVISAKKDLHNETLELVASATEKVVGKKMTGAADESLIIDALKAAK